MTAVRYVFSYIAMYAVIGLLYWILNDLLVTLRSQSETTGAYDIANFLWGGSLVLILVLSTFWLFRKLKEWEVVR